MRLFRSCLLWPYNAIKWNQVAGVEYKVLLALACSVPQLARFSVSAPDSRGCQQNMLVKLASVGLTGDYNPSKPCVVANRTNSWVSTFSKQCLSPKQQVWQLSLATGYPKLELKLTRTPRQPLAHDDIVSTNVSSTNNGQSVQQSVQQLAFDATKPR
eukprot:SM000002S05731  [mRNA]  locus=s2:1896624:1897318:+ [translate_table: standard]